MSGGVFLIVMLAAALHAGWNAIVKGGGDKAASMTAVVIGQGIAALIALPFAGAMDWAACWPWLIAGVALHFGYQVFLIAAYQVGDLTQVYPIARGASPLIVAVTTMVAFGATYSQSQLLGIVTIALGIASISLVRRGDGTFQVKAAVLALITGCFIAAYSISDGMGARLAGTSLGFYAFTGMIEAVWFALVMGVVAPAKLRASLRLRREMVIGGGASFIAYALVVHAFTLAPIALVTALRETSIIFALLIGVGLLGERLSLLKVVSTMVTLAGAASVRLAR